MRRQDRHIINGALIGGGILTLADIFFQWLEHKDAGKKFTWDSYDGWRSMKWGLTGGLIGAGTGYLVYKYKISEEEKLPFNSDSYLKRVLTEESLKADPALLQKALQTREQIKQWLLDVYGNKLVVAPQNTGSFLRKTAINSNYDLDIVLPFKKDGYNTLEEMYYDVLEKVGGKYSGVAKVTKQTKAIGLTFSNNNYDVHFDIVPGREINNYLEDKDLNLYVKPDFIWEKGRSFKTNISLQKQLTINKPEARKIIKLFKAYRDRNSLPLPTVIVDQLVVEAFEKSNFDWSRSETDNLLYTMEHMANKLSNQSIIDYANTNNNLSNKVSDYQRNYISEQLLRDIEKVEANPRNMREIFEL